MKHSHSFRLSAALLAGALLTLAACGKKTDSGDAANKPVATVNGKPITKAMLDAYANAMTNGQAQQLNDMQRGQVLDQLVNMQLAAAAAEQQGLHNDAEFQARMELGRLNSLQEAYLKKFMETHVATDDEAKAEYDAYVAGLGRQYHARHILVESKAVADSIIQQLKSGADFAKLAAKESKDGSGKQGGDLGWFTLADMVKPFSDALAALEKGKFTQTPVQTQFGWHVIKLEDFRSQAPQPFDDVKEQAKKSVQNKKARAHLEDLRKAAKIEKDGEPVAAPAAAPTPAPTAEQK